MTQPVQDSTSTFAMPTCCQSRSWTATRSAQRLLGRAFLLLLAVFTVPLTCEAQSSVLTQHNDNSRSGLNSQETVLNTSNVNVSQFGKLFSVTVDGQVYAQPLYVPNVVFPGNVTHNVLIVATENDSIYAFDADGASQNPLWHASLVDAAHGATAGEVPLNSASTLTCEDLTPQVGITSTPVIDMTTSPTPTIYAEAKSMNGSGFYHRLHALDITTGAEKPQGPVLITASVNATGDGSVNGILQFDSHDELNRPGLLLLNGIIYVGFGSHCDTSPFHGWIFAYNAASLSQTSVFVTTPDTGLGAVWMSGTGLAADSNGYIYVPTGNGYIDTNPPVTSFGDSILKLSTINSNQQNGYLSVADYFTPYDQNNMFLNDEDLGSGGILLLPDQPGSYPHVLVEAGKYGRIYLLNRDQLTSNPSNPGQPEHYCSNCGTNDPQILQETGSSYMGAMFGTPVYWNNHVYFWGVHDVLRSIPLSNGLLNFGGLASSTTTSGFPGPTPSISSNGNTSGTAILWAISSAGVYAYNAENLSQVLWTSTQASGGRDQAGGYVKFSTPTIANAKVYVGASGQVDVYGLLPQVTPASVTLRQGQTQQFTTALSGATWSVSPAGAGSISSTGFYTAPANIPTGQTVTVTATATGASASATVILAPTVAGSGSATFIQLDTTTQGNWLGVYGADGYSLADAGQSLPSYDPTFAVQNQLNWTWISGATDPRALETTSEGNRIAAAWYSPTTFNFDVNLTDGQAHQVALYILDWDGQGRAETIQIFDASPNQAGLLQQENVSTFASGTYAVFSISGHVTISVTSSAGPNAVVSGVFFGGSSTTESVSVSPSSTNLGAGGTQQFTATIHNGANQAVTWTISAVNPPSGATGSFSGTTVGLYTAPATLTGAETVTVKAILADGTFGTATVNLSTGTTGGGATATFIPPPDTTTEGSWQGVYGSDGSALAGVTPQNVPSYATFAVQNQLNWTWVANTTDPRALIMPGTSSGTAQAWYSPTTFSFDVNFTDGGMHQFALYAVDWDGGGRSETIRVVDATTNNQLDVETLSNFGNGVYLVWKISGHVKINVTSIAGSNGVVSGVFFGGGSSTTESVSVGPGSVNLRAGGTQQFTATIHNGANQAVTWTISAVNPSNGATGSFSGTTAGLYTAPATLTGAETVTVKATLADGTFGTATVNLSTGTTGGGATATFIPPPDTTTEGSWQGVYGSDGTALAGVTPENVPSYATFAVQNQITYTWNSSTTDPRALQTGVGTGRIAAAWYNPTTFNFDVNFTDGATHQLALYALDWDSGGRTETVQVVDAATNNQLDMETISSFTNGVYLAWKISGHVKINVTATAGANAVISGVFFGAEGSTAPASAAFVASDTTTQGNWIVANYGTSGYFLANSAQANPAFAMFSVQNQLNWTWLASTTDPRALVVPGTSSGIAATWYSPAPFSFDVNLTDGKTHQIALYVLDWDAQGRSETIQILDATTNAALNSQSISNLTNGVYLIWNISGHIKITVAANAGPNAVVSGAFFK